MLPKNTSNSRTPSLTAQQSYGNIKTIILYKLLVFTVPDIKKKKKKIHNPVTRVFSAPLE
jgi:hypothetical protein